MSEKNENDVVLDEVPVVEETKVEEPVIVAPSETKEVPTLDHLESGAIASGTSKPKNSKPKTEVVEEKVTLPNQKTALFSTRNLYADGFGKINVGYNIVPNKYVEFWLKQRGVRVATPEEVAEAFA